MRSDGANVMQSICPGCGQPSPQGLCPACMLKSMQIISCPKHVEVTVCSVCGAKLIRGKWQITERTAEELAYEASYYAVLVHSDIENPELDLRLLKRGSTRYLARANLKGTFKGIIVEESCEFPIKVILTACDRCSRMAGKYFEAVIQIRGSSRPPTKEDLDKCKDMALSLADAAYRRGDQLAFVQDIKETKGGVDLVIGSTQLGRQIARAIFEHFGGRTEESASLAGKKDGNDIYRTTILVRFPNLRKGDIISDHGTLFEVTGYDRRRTLLRSLEGYRRSSIKEEDAARAIVLGNRADARKAMVVAKDEKVLEFLDPDSYEVAVASRPKSLDISVGEEVVVVRTGEGFIVLG
jgi:60S ribosomal export protein NMD3